MTDKPSIDELIKEPEKLEKYYRELNLRDKKDFGQKIAELHTKNAESELITAWYWRLHFKDRMSSGNRSDSVRDIIWITVLSLLSGILFKIITNDSFATEQAIFGNIGFVFFPFLWTYFMRFRRPDWKWVIILGIFIASSVLYINVIPYEDSQSFYIAALFLPFILWFIWMLFYLERDWKSADGRIEFLKFNGELVIVSVIILIGGMVLCGVIFFLFLAIDIDVADFLLNWIVIFGVTATPLVAAEIVRSRIRNEQYFAPILAKIFSPLFTISLFIFLLFMIGSGKNPYQDRDFLIIFNGVMILILAVLVFIITEKSNDDKIRLQDYLNTVLMAVTVMIGLTSVSAMIFRIGSYGITPNKLMTAGTNLIILVHLIGLLILNIRYLLKKGPISDVKQWLVNYLPVYAGWAVFCVFILPLIFKFA